jgi:hypothetical protein
MYFVSNIFTSRRFRVLKSKSHSTICDCMCHLLLFYLNYKVKYKNWGEYSWSIWSSSGVFILFIHEIRQPQMTAKKGQWMIAIELLILWRLYNGTEKTKFKVTHHNENELFLMMGAWIQCLKIATQGWRFRKWYIIAVGMKRELQYHNSVLCKLWILKDLLVRSVQNLINYKNIIIYPVYNLFVLYCFHSLKYNSFSSEWYMLSLCNWKSFRNLHAPDLHNWSSWFTSLLVLTENCVVLTIPEDECRNGQGSLGNSDDRLTLVEEGEGTHTGVPKIL